jgi:Ca-activated chloride channel family protein
MRFIYCFLFLIFISSLSVKANGVAVIDAHEGEYLTLITNNVNVEVDNQIALVKNLQTFQNKSDDTVSFKYAYPLKKGASAIELRWNYNDEWRYTKISPNPQDTTLPGGGSGNEIDYILNKYLGDYAVFMDIPQTLEPNEKITVELSYVEFLNYSYGDVYFNYIGDYTDIQNTKLLSNDFRFDLKSERKINSIILRTDIAYSKELQDNEAFLTINKTDEKADFNVDIVYTLSLDDLGLFGMSTYLDEAIDSIGNGYFMFVAEPDDGEAMKTLHKNFVLVIDESGSMGDPFGSNGRRKIYDAMETANYIIDNLNEGDYFNIISFDNTVKHFQDSLIAYNDNTKDKAKYFIDHLIADGGTNISGSLDAAIEQFDVPDENFLNILIFFTDGLPSEGIKDPYELSSTIKSKNGDKEIQIYPFGIGDDVNKQLLGLLADENDGIVAFLENNDITESITEFYNYIRSPLLIDAQIEYSPDIVTNTVPAKLPNLYKGSQMIVAGRYKTTEYDSLGVKLLGTVYGENVEYNYKIPLAKEEIEKNNIIPKIWAKLRINDLFAEYYRYNENSDTAKTIKEQIKDLSVKYGVLTEFTSFVDKHTYVEIFSFNGYKTNQGIELYWNTSFDNNIAGFYIERKEVNSDAEWKRIAFIPLKNSSADSYKYLDKKIKTNTLYHYRINQADIDGTGNSEIYSNILTIFYDMNFSLNIMQNYPNPVTSSTVISFFLPNSGHAKLEILDISGNTIETLLDVYMIAGNNQITWNPKNIASGSYFYRLHFDNQIIHKKLIIE